jgi:hypothetical protein
MEEFTKVTAEAGQEAIEPRIRRVITILRRIYESLTLDSVGRGISKSTWHL